MATSPAAECTLPAAPADTRQEAARHGVRILAVLSALMAFASISTDLYLPAMPLMGTALHADNGLIELTISGYLVGFSLGQLFWGPLGDRYGRRLPIALGLVLFVIGSAGCAMAMSAPALIAWRALQALGACASVVLARAMVRDLYAGPRAAQMMSTLMTVMAIAPLLGPSIGGQILHLSSWRAIFWVLVVVGFATLLALKTLPESLPPERRNPEPLTRAFLRYGELLRNRRILAYAGAGGFFYGAMYAYIAGTPFAYITYHHVPPEWYGTLFAAGIVGIMVTNMTNARLVTRFGSDALMRFGTAAAAVAGVALAVTSARDLGGLAGLVIPLFVFISATGFIVANAIAGALGVAPERAGAVSALIGATQYGTGIAGSALVGFFADGTPWPMGCVIGAMAVASLFCACLTLPRPGITSLSNTSGDHHEKARSR
jgi:DHA1 family bicyclomycin/chloramphenicol resistance-like MFS transporter